MKKVEFMNEGHVRIRSWKVSKAKSAKRNHPPSCTFLNKTPSHQKRTNQSKNNNAPRQTLLHFP